MCTDAQCVRERKNAALYFQKKSKQRSVGQVESEQTALSFRLPPLNALRAFEAAARHENISRAAAELCVSPGAISRHIAILERHIGQRLLVRQHRGVIPTAAGAGYLQEVAQAFRQIETATRSLDQDTVSSEGLRVRLFATLMSEWLAPRLDGFRALHPQIRLRLSATVQPIDSIGEDADIAAMLRPENPGNLHSELLFHALFTPVCAPALLEGDKPLRRAEDLRHHTLLYSPPHVRYWTKWLALAGADAVKPEVGLRFESSSHAYQAARRGGGVALGQVAFLLDDIQSGRLVAPFRLAVENPRPYCMVCERSRRYESDLAAFSEWVLAEARQTRMDIKNIFGTTLKHHPL